MENKSGIIVALNPDEDVVKMLSEAAVVRLNPYPRPMTRDELISSVGDVDAVILGGEGLDRSIIEVAERLRIIARFGLGYQNIDYRAAAEGGIYVTYSPSPVMIGP